MSHHRPTIAFGVGDRVTFESVSVYIDRQHKLDSDRFHVEVHPVERDGSVDYGTYETGTWHLDDFADRAARSESVTVEYADRNVRTPEVNS